MFSEYFKKEHLLSRIDARVKLLVAIIILIMVLSYKGFVFPLFVVSLSLVLCIRMKIPLRIFILRFSEPMFIALVLVILKFLFSGDDEIISLNLLGIRIAGYRDGLADGLMIASRIIGAVSIVAVLGFSTPFTEFMAGLSWFRVPKGFIEILMFAYRYIFVLLEDAMVIYNAQKNRLGYSSIRRGLSSFGILTGSIVFKAFEHSQNITVAMVQRGYTGDIPIAMHRPFKMGDIATAILIIAVMGTLWKIQ